MSDPERLAEQVDELIDTLAEHGYGILAKADLDSLNAAVAERDALTTRLAAAKERAEKAGWLAEQDAATIDALTTRLAAAEDERHADLAREALIVQDAARWKGRADALATENQAMRAVVDAARELVAGEVQFTYVLEDAIAEYDRLASLPPVADERTEP